MSLLTSNSKPGRLPPFPQEQGVANAWTESSNSAMISYSWSTKVRLLVVHRPSRERDTESKRSDDARKRSTSPKQNQAMQPLFYRPSILAGKRFLFFQFCNNPYHLRLCPHSRSPQPLSNPCFKSQGGTEATFTWIFNNPIKEREAQKKY